MRNLAETEAAADVLPLEEKQELFLFVATRLRAQRGSLPQPRKLSGEQVAGWIAEDEADRRRMRERRITNTMFCERTWVYSGYDSSRTHSQS